MTGMIRNWRKISVALVALLAAGGANAAIKRGKDLTLEQLTQKADAIVVGTCKEKQARWVRGHIETDYEIQVDEQLKGDKRFGAGKSFRMTVMGGESTTPPITQFTAMQPHMYKGEQVALFLRAQAVAAADKRAKAAAIGSKLLDSPQVVGLNQGKFSIVIDEADGKSKVTKLSLENYGIMPSDSAMQRVLQAVAKRQIKTTEGPLVELGGGLVTTPEGKAALDQTAAQDPAGAKALAEQLSGKAADDETSGSQVKPLRGLPIPVQNLDEFKQQVRQFAN